MCITVQIGELCNFTKERGKKNKFMAIIQHFFVCIEYFYQDFCSLRYKKKVMVGGNCGLVPTVFSFLPVL